MLQKKNAEMGKRMTELEEVKVTVGVKPVFRWKFLDQFADSLSKGFLTS